VAKVNFTKLPLGHPLTPGMVWDNLDQAATALSGNIAADQRQENRSYFSMCFNKVRLAEGALRTVPADTDASGAVSYSTIQRPVRIAFKVPPLQEEFNTQLVTDHTTPNLVLESVAISFDNLNQNKPVSLDTGLPDSAASFDKAFSVTVSTGSGAQKSTVTVPVSALNSTNEEIVQRPNPTINAFVGANVDPYGDVLIEFQSPCNLGNHGIDSLVVHVVFSYPIVERDTAALAGEIIQNAPFHNLARSAPTNTLVRPVAGTLIEATNATLSGVQDSFEQLDRQVREKLGGGLTRWSEVRSGTETLTQDQGYFCIMVPLFNIPEDQSLQKWTTPAYDSLTGYLRVYPKTSGANALMDRAVIPIVAPGAIHHVGVYWDRIVSTLHPVSSPGLFEVRMDFGLALGCRTRAREANFTQVCLVEDRDVNYQPFTNDVRSFFAPIVYSTHATAPDLGKGFVTQGRPFYFGNEIDYTGLTKRRNVATTTAANAEVVPPTNGTEQFFEIRCNLSLFDTVTSGGIYQDINTQPGYFGNGSGVVVCLYGKMALVE